ncbi:hypothetical protein KsCSTR_29450 [Candidatus Kuenenia stuttgartiensis]|uniref:Uncharacterized protein n=1 Tax=Kuenenia stuttgartiensis TaxID=174633 RepID=Q1Q5Q9_KUEST|nr:hypothetical protein KsCSTR_29450 [Candidatus Kuenenia stuttgartiensis]CAJ75353.1 unknown protein [Candidatus Kuenenia stuttgartiensis]
MRKISIGQKKIQCKHNTLAHYLQNEWLKYFVTLWFFEKRKSERRETKDIRRLSSVILRPR